MATKEQPVEFEGVSRFYEPGTDVSVTIRKSPKWRNAKHSDWVGIFPVGWKSLKDFATFVYVKMMEVVVFRSAALSFTLSDSFYQFVYVSADGPVLTTSYPFQFQIPFDDISMHQDSDEVVVIQPKQLQTGDSVPVLSGSLTEQLTEGLDTTGRLLNEETLSRSGGYDYSGVSSRTSVSVSAPTSGVFMPPESTESLKSDRDKYMKQFRQEQKINKMQEKNYFELQTKYEKVINENTTLRDKVEAVNRKMFDVEHENLQLNESLRVALDDKVGLEKEVERLGRLVAELSRQNRYQSEEMLAHKVKPSHKESVDLAQVVDMSIHIARPPPYCVPGASILNHVSPDTSHDQDPSHHQTHPVLSPFSDAYDELECPMCHKKFPKSLGPTSFQMHVNMHFQ